MKNVTTALRSHVNVAAHGFAERLSGGRLFARLLALAVVLASAHRVAAHDLIQEQLVQVSMRLQGATLGVHLQLPVTVLAESTLPRTTDGALDLSNIAEPLRIVAADAIRNLDVLEDGQALQQTAFASRLSPDNSTVEADVSFTTRGDTGFSARLGTFTGTPQRQVRTQVEFVRQDGRPFTISIMGPAQRVDFDPAAGATLTRFARETLQSLLTPGLHLLMLLCLLVPQRASQATTRLTGVLLGAQAVGLVGATLSGRVPALATPAMLVAGSAVVIAALQVITQTRTSLVTAVTVLFGVCFGAVMAQTLAGSLQFAGAHVALAVITAAATALIAQAWGAAAMWAARSWLEHRGVPTPALAIAAAIVAGHSALHHVMTAANDLMGRGSFAASHATTLVALAWVAVALAVAASSRSRIDGSSAGVRQVPRQSLS